MSMHAPASDQPSEFGGLLRDFRRVRKLSQLDLATDAEISQRHLSFLESGRARPSRQMVLLLAQTLDVPLRERNRLLASAGFAGLYPQRTLEAVDMRPVRQALELMLRHHEPYPAIVIDRSWNVFMHNDAITRVFGVLGDVEAMWQRVCDDGPRNILKLTLHPLGLQPYIRNLAEIAPAILARVAREALDYPAVSATLEEVLAYPGIPARWRSIDLRAPQAPVISTVIGVGHICLSLFTTLTTFGTAQDITADELRVEQFFPADADSERLLRTLAGQSG